MQQFPIGLPVIIIVIIILYILASSIRILREYERGVIFRLGRVLDGGVKGPGLILLIPIIDKMVKVSLRIVVMDVPPQDVITQDNVSIKVNAVIYFRVIDPQKAVIEIENYLAGTSQLSQTTLRSVLGQSELDDLLSQRDKINVRLQHIIDEQTEPWGVKVTHVEVKQIDLPQEMQRAMARQAELATKAKRAPLLIGRVSCGIPASPLSDRFGPFIGTHSDVIRQRKSMSSSVDFIVRQVNRICVTSWQQLPRASFFRSRLAARRAIDALQRRTLMPAQASVRCIIRAPSQRLFPPDRET